jgi:hypothetical protein
MRPMPAWAEAWAALSEAGINANLIPNVLRDASNIFVGLGELTAEAVDELFRFWEVPEVPAGIESTLEEAFLAQAPTPERKTQLEAFFRMLNGANLQEALMMLYTARRVPDWKKASSALKALDSKLAGHPELFKLAREIVA